MNRSSPYPARERRPADAPAPAPAPDATPADLDLCEHLPQQRLEWRIERVAWGFLYALLAAIACGLLGQGPLAQARVGDADSGELRYQRLATVKSSMELDFTLPPSAGEVRIVLARDYLAQVEVRQLTPQPQRAVLESDGLAFVFAADAQRGAQVRLSVEAQTPGRLEGWFRIGVGERRHFRQFLYP